MTNRSHHPSGWTREKWSVKKRLDKNRALLKAWRCSSSSPPCESKVCEGGATWLAQRGYDFAYHTHVEPLPDGRLRVMCFDEGYVLNGGDISPCQEEEA
ncbi:MAG: hypothetical protein L7S02_05315 [Flavobacteriales bacterium]|jgi:hypothetical protein|nr:hypothetical protein [Flavobacteriales bacterium]